jgi:putative transposase
VEYDEVNDTYRISDALWEQIKALLPPELPKPRGGRPRMDDRKAMEAILYVLRTNCKWEAIPRSMGTSSTVRRRFREWRRAGLFQRMWVSGLLTYNEMREVFWYGKRRVKRRGSRATVESDI